MIRGNLVPLLSFFTVLRHAVSVLVTETKIHRGPAMSRIGGLSIPARGFRPALCHAQTFCVVHAEDCLRRSVSFIGRCTEMRHGRAQILRDASPGRIYVPDAELPLRICRTALASYFSAGPLANFEIFLRRQGWGASQKQNHCE